MIVVRLDLVHRDLSMKRYDAPQSAESVSRSGR